MISTFKKHELLFISLVLLACFVLIDLFRSSFSGVNSVVNLWASAINNNFFRLPAELISYIFETAGLLIISTVIAILFFLTHRKRYGILLIASMVGIAILVDVSKILIASDRPLNEIIAETNFSFPSGHVASTLVLFGILTFVAWTYWKTNKPRGLTAILYVSMIVLVGFDRIYLNVHWFSDVVGAIFLGAFWLTFSIYIFNSLSWLRSRWTRQLLL